MKTIVTLPTYNEASNIRDLIAQLRNLGVEVLVADDDSPDGTAKIVEEAAARDEGVHLLLRKENRGRGYAGAEAFIRALALKADRIVEMDADFSHRPEDLPRLLDALDKGADVAIGSRFCPGGEDARSGIQRNFLSRFSATWARWFLNLPVKDCNSGFKAFSAYAMSLVEPETLVSEGPGIVHEVLVRAHRRGLKMVETPIRFADRRSGVSSLSAGRLLQGFIAVLVLRRRAQTGRLWKKK